MRYLTNTYIFLGVILIFTSCSNRQYQTLFEQKNALPNNISKSDTTSFRNYRIKPQDILQVRNLQNIKYIVDETPVTANAASGGGATSQGQSYQVEQDGTVALPVIGRVPVIGLTRTEAAKVIEDLYRAKLLKDPIIEVTITNLKVTVLGEVKAQGSFPLIKDKTTLIDIIGAAGGLTDKANEKNVKIIHGTDEKAKVTVIDLNDIKSVYDPNTMLKDGDIIYVAQNTRAVRNDNLQNFSFLVQPALLVINAILLVFTFTRH